MTISSKIGLSTHAGLLTVPKEWAVKLKVPCFIVMRSVLSSRMNEETGLERLCE